MKRKFFALIVLGGCDPHASDEEQSAYDEGYAQGYQDAAKEVDDRLDALESQCATTVDELLVSVGEMQIVIDEMRPVVEDADLLLTYVTVDETDALGPAVKVIGANVYVQSGSGSTDGDVNGVGNLIVGYGEVGAFDRTGSHNLVLGVDNGWTSYSGIVASNASLVSAPYAAAIGGQTNTVDGQGGVIVGGSGNYIYTEVEGSSFAAITGGESNAVSYPFGWIGGGKSNAANAWYSAIAGGESNMSLGAMASLLGGYRNIASGGWSSVTGGSESTTATEYSVVTAGQALPTSIGAASSLALCRTADLSGSTLNTTSDAIYIADGLTGDEVCDSWRDETPCLEVHFVFLSGTGHTETNAHDCSESIDYSTTDAVGAWACCNR